MTLLSLSEIWAAGYKTTRLAKSPDAPCPQFAVVAPDGKVIGYATSAVGVEKLVYCHQRTSDIKGPSP